MMDELLMVYNLGKLMRSQWFSYEELKKLQEKKLRAIISYVYKEIPVYHKKFRDVDLKPDDINRIEDLVKIPILTKAEIQENFPHNIVNSKVDLDACWTPHTGGSTGTPLTMVYDKKAEYFQKAAALRPNLSVGQRIWDKWAIVTSPDHFIERRWFQKFGLLNTYYVSLYDDVATQIKNLEEIRPKILDGYSSPIWIIASSEEIEESNLSPKLVFTTAELLDPPMRKDIEETFSDADVLDQFGCVELGRTAWECEEHEGYHIDMEAVVMEFIKDGEQIHDGESGEILYTGLYNYAMPLIRYSIEDIGIPSTEKPACGRGLPLMKVLEGRKDDFIVISDGRIISPRLISVIMKKVSGIKLYLFIQESVNKFVIKIVAQDKSSEDKIEKDLKEVIRHYLTLNEDDELKINFVDKITRKTRKLRKVVSNVKLGKS